MTGEREPREFSWSVSRHDAFMRCRRHYYYSYYGAHEDAEILRLKRLSALPLWAGNVVHETIADVLREHDELPSPEVQEALIHSVVHERMLGEWRDSEASGADFRLFEHEYDVEVDQDDKKLVVGTVMRSLRNFFASDTLREAYDVRRDQWLTVEELTSFPIDGVPVFLRMDLAYRTADGHVVIVDWKTGRTAGRFSGVQLAGYALYAAEHGWVERPEDLATELAYLVAPRYVRRRVTRRSLDSARRFVEKSSRNMRALLADPERNVAEQAAFERIDSPRVCRRCNFRRLCFPRESAGVDARSDVATG